ncbi:TPA: YadA-like family protein [Escherichia coli]|nr:YadA-like family protein [Escherichia coli]HBE4473408.1 YadA-like family protein [Escherichia coli]HBE4580211.1 YadA-like family protein [Escherichia coli]HBE4585088.1 YadA-like family protein [Escherichia coli]HBE5078744.1 YadA-like family protein [Escherichia coli]
MAVSVGGNGKTRQIINVAAGTEDTDVVNVSQLKREAAAREDGDKNTLIQSKNYSDAGDKNTLIQSKNYSDSRDKNTLVQANSYTNRTVSTASASTLAKANQYTNEKFNSLKKQVDNNRKRSDSGIAGAMAMTALAPVPYKDYSFGMAMAGYREEGAIAAGFNIKTSDNSLMKVSASWDSQNGGGVAAGFNVGW